MQSVSKTEASEYDNFKTNISDKSSLLWNKLKECTSESFWKTAYGIYKAPQSIAYSTEAVKQTKEFTIEKMSTMRNATSEAVGAVASAAEAKTMEMVQKSKDGIESGKRAIREAGMAVKSHAELGVSTAWETLKNSKNVIKQKLIIAQIGYFESQGKRISAEAASAFAKANRIRASLSALEA